MRRKIWNITTARSTNITINNINTFKFYNSNDLAFRGGGSGGGANYQMPPPTICAPKRENKWYFPKLVVFTQNFRLRLKISGVLRKNFACGAKSVVFTLNC